MRATARGSVANGRAAVSEAARERPDLVVLDLMLPGIDGLEVMRRLREQGSDRIAVILLTARGEEADRVIGLRLGADDYVVKPFSPAELIARIDAVLRRVDTSPAVGGTDRARGSGDRSGRAPACRCAASPSSSPSASSTCCCSSPGTPARCSHATS